MKIIKNNKLIIETIDFKVHIIKRLERALFLNYNDNRAVINGVDDRLKG